MTSYDKIFILKYKTQTKRMKISLFTQISKQDLKPALIFKMNFYLK